MIDWLRFTFSTMTTAPPGQQQIRFNAATAAAATTVWIHFQSDDGIDAYYSLMGIDVDAPLVIQDANDHTIAIEFKVTTAPIDLTTYAELGVTFVQGIGELTNQQNVLVIAQPPTTAVQPAPPFTGFVPTPWTWPQGVYSVMVSGPTEEPLTIVEGKLRAGLTWPDGDPRDALMEDFIRSARAQVEHDTGLALLTQTHDVTFPDVDPGALVPMPAQTQPTQSLTGPALLTGELAKVLPSMPLHRGRHVYRPGVRAWLPWPGPGTFTVVSGWPTAAALKTEAPSLYHAVGLLVAHYATLGRDLATVGETSSKQEARLMPLGYDDAIGPHRLVWVT